MTPAERGDAAAFFASAPALLPVAEALYDVMTARWPSMEARVCKTQVSLRDGRGFGALWLPNRAEGRGALGLSLGLPEPLCSPRVWRAVPIRPGRYTVHLLLRGMRDVDEEMIQWLTEAHDWACRPSRARR